MDERDEDMAYDTGIHPMSAIKHIRHSGIMLLKLPEPRQANLILITKESTTKNLVNLINSLELMFFHLSKMGFDLFCDMKLRRPILSPV
jgi:hypothetical protein